jgi:hypothetical protein
VSLEAIHIQEDVNLQPLRYLKDWDWPRTSTVDLLASNNERDIFYPYSCPMLLIDSSGCHNVFKQKEQARFSF